MLSNPLRQSVSLVAACYQEPHVLLPRTPPAGETSCSPQVRVHCNSDHPMLNVCQHFWKFWHTMSVHCRANLPVRAGGALLLSAGGQLSAPLAAFSETELDTKKVKVQYLSAIAKNSQRQALKVRMPSA